ncbi:MAG: ABC transporter substrate-binding protein [Sulfolobales archaeon]
MRVRLLATVLVIAVVALISGYALGLSTSREVYTVTITSTITKEVRVPTSIVDGLGREVVFEGVPSRVVSLAPSITETLFALGLGDRVVGVTSYCNYPPEVPKLVEEGKIAVIGGFWNPDPEKIITLKPDLIIGSAGTPPHIQLKDRFESLGLKIVYIYGSTRNIYDLYRDVSLIAKIFNVEDRASKLVSSIQAEINNVTKKLQDVNVTKLKVLILLGPPSWGLISVGGDTFIDWVVSTAGGINIARKFSGWPRLDYEYIISQNPDVIIVSAMNMNYEEVINDMRKTLLIETKAFKEGRVYLLDKEADDILMRFGPRVGKAVQLIAKILYPELFGEPDIPVVYKLGTTVPKTTTITPYVEVLSS